MKEKLSRILRIALPVLAVLLFAIAIIPSPVSVSAAGAYDFEITQYDVDMTVEADRTVAVEEKISVSFTGYDSHGIIRDFVLKDGVRYKHIEAECDDPDFDPYFENDDVDVLSLYLRGDGRTTGQSRTYTVRYTMLLPDTKDGYLPLDVVGYGWQCEIKNVTVTVNLPDGLSGYKIYSGRAGTKEDERTDGGTLKGNVVTILAESLSWEGITLDLQFEEGVLGKSTDPAFWTILIMGAILLVVGILAVALFFKNPVITKTVNLTAPDEMDPLKMGKLIDNTIDNEDLGAVVFYLAEQGYLRIDLKDEKNPTLIRTEKAIDGSLPDYLGTFLNGLFKSGNKVKTSSLTNKFYKTAERVKREVSATCKAPYKPMSITFILLFGIASALLLGGFVCLYSFFTVGIGYLNLFGLIVCAVPYAVMALALFLILQNRYKWKERVKLLVCGGALAATVMFDAIVGLAIPNAAITTGAMFLMACISTLLGIAGGMCAVYTKEHAELLGQILGFKQFILYTERDKVEFMLKDDPELFYRILPYAQVLGVTDAWTDKFEGLNMTPPSYLYGTSNLYDFVVWNSVFRSMNRTFSSNLVSRPSSSGSGFNSGGGFGGGFGGGGFGGGGGRGC